jgi:transposase-like protein
MWEELKRTTRLRIQELIQDMLDEELEDFLGRKKYERIGGDGFRGYRNGYGKVRKLTRDGVVYKDGVAVDGSINEGSAAR